MPQSKNFIITQDESVGNILIANGFRLLSKICDTYTFVNDTNKKFNFDSIDTTKIHFTNKLNI